mmetsp:Transcript_16811/g.38691  ORF Transcript_16811/g.38691 Transcript_16811/m.38691 type:complete len:239 (-) Transcript_16811:281-997(-)
MLGTFVHCIRSCCDNDDDENEQSSALPTSYDPPTQTPIARPSQIANFEGTGHDADTQSDDSVGNNCCRSAEDATSPASCDGGRRGKRVFWFWHRLSEKTYEEVNQDEMSGFSMTPPRGMPRRSSSRDAKSKGVINSPLKTASSFDPSNEVPAIHSEEVVLPGSALQEQMASKMAESLEEQGDECVICMDVFTPDNPRMPTICGCGENKTYFHLPCLYQWIDQSRNCPSCGQQLVWEEF